VVQAAVDVDELAEAGSASPRLLHALPLAPRGPHAVADHPVANRRHRNANSTDEQFLMCLSLSEVCVLAMHERDGELAQLRCQRAVTGPAALARDEAFGALSLIRRVHTLDLANGQPELLCSDPLCRSALSNAPHQRETRQLIGIHRDQTHWVWPYSAPTVLDVAPRRFYKLLQRRLSINGYVNNLTDVVYATSINANPGSNLRFFNNPRTVGVRVKVEW
jgi:hypothetical protein